MTWKPTLFGVIALTLAPAALAAPTELVVHNTFDGEAHLFVNGRFEGAVPGDARMGFGLRPGVRDIVVRRPSGFVLHDSRLMLHRGTATEIRVVAPLADLRLTNPTAAPLRVDVGRHDGVWIAPNTAVTLPVRAGRLTLVSTVRERSGDRIVERRDVWVEPGRPTSARLAYTPPPPPTRLVIVNSHGRDLRVLVDGTDRGALRRGATLALPCGVGRVDVQLVEVGGPVVFADRVSIARGADTRVVVEGRRATRVSTVLHRVTSPPRAVRPSNTAIRHVRWDDDPPWSERERDTRWRDDPARPLARPVASSCGG